MSWTDERVDLLKKLWGEGRTAAEIASELGGITRNAVIGKAHRLKLSNRVSPIQQDNKKITLPMPANRDKPVVVSVPRTAAAPVSQIKIRNEGVKMSELRDRMCRWPFGDPKNVRFPFLRLHFGARPALLPRPCARRLSSRPHPHAASRRFRRGAGSGGG